MADEDERIEAERIRRRDEYLFAEKCAGWKARWATMDEAQLRIERQKVRARPEVERWFLEAHPELAESPVPSLKRP